MARRSQCLRRLTAYGRFNARTMTKRKYQGLSALSGGTILGPPAAWALSLTLFSDNRGHGGPVTQHTHPSYPGIFL